MKDVRELLEFLFGQTDPWLIVLIIIGTAPFMLRVVQDLLAAFQVAREKKLSLLLSYVDAGIDKKPRFSVEKAFHHYFGIKLEYAEIHHLMARPSPSTAVQDFVWGRAFLELDTTSGNVRYRKPYRVRLREFGFYAVFMAGYLGTALSGLFFAVAAYAKQPRDIVLTSLVVFLGCVLIWWLSVLGIRGMAAARRAVEAYSSSTSPAGDSEGSPTGRCLRTSRRSHSSTPKRTRNRGDTGSGKAMLQTTACSWRRRRSNRRAVLGPRDLACRLY